MQLANCVTVVTGAAGDGIGRAIALRLAHAGADVAVLDIRPSDTTIGLIEATGRCAIAVRTDLRDVDQIPTSLERVVASLGPIGVLVNAAATINRKPFLEITLDDWDRVHTVNLRAVFVASQWVARAMVAEGRAGSIINIASVGAMLATAEQAHYCAAKGGVLALTRCIAVELAPFGIRVNAISPGAVETDINRELLADPAFRSMRMRRIPLGRVAMPDEIAGAALLLASDDGSFITGANIVVDGGRTAW